MSQACTEARSLISPPVKKSVSSPGAQVTLAGTPASLAADDKPCASVRVVCLQAQVGGIVQQPQGGEAGGNGERIARQRAPPGRRCPPGATIFHERARTRVGGGRQPAADHLAEDREVRRDARPLLGPAAGHAEAGDHLVEHEQARPDALAASRQELEEAGRRRHEAHVGRKGLGQDGRRGGRSSRTRLHGVAVVPRDDDRVGGLPPSSRPGLEGMPWVARPEPASAREAVHVAVVGA